MNEKTASQILQEARALVAQGRCRGRNHVVSHGRHYYCIVGALRMAIHGDQRIYTDHSAVDVLLRLVEKRQGYFLDAYNDRPDTTTADVLSLFDEALAEVTK